MVGEADPHGAAPPSRRNLKLLSDGASKAMFATFKGAVPALPIDTSSGAGSLLEVTLPKSNVAGRTWIAGAVCVVAGVGLLGVAAGVSGPPAVQPAKPRTPRTGSIAARRQNVPSILLLRHIVVVHVGLSLAVTTFAQQRLAALASRRRI
jgi:hypothetical protein